MKTTKKIIALLSVVALIACVFAACSKTANDDSKKKTYIIATDTAFNPFEYTDANGNFVGIDVDLLAAIAEDQGFNYKLNSLGWDGAIQACKSGQADGMIAGASITNDRIDKGWIFSDSYYPATQSIFVKKGSNIKSMDDLKGATVAVKNATQGADYANSIKDKYNLTIDTYEDSPTMYKAVTDNKAVACFEDTEIMNTSIKSGLDIQVVPGSETETQGYGFAIFDSKNQELVDMFNAGLKNIKDNGKYDEIIAKYIKK